MRPIVNTFFHVVQSVSRGVGPAEEAGDGREIFRIAGRDELFHAGNDRLVEVEHSAHFRGNRPNDYADPRGMNTFP
jgi:hypothetical protein